MTKPPTKRERLEARLAGPGWNIGFKLSPTRPTRCRDGLSRPFNRTLEIEPGIFVSLQEASELALQQVSRYPASDNRKAGATLETPPGTDKES